MKTTNASTPTPSSRASPPFDDAHGQDHTETDPLTSSRSSFEDVPSSPGNLTVTLVAHWGFLSTQVLIEDIRTQGRCVFQPLLTDEGTLRGAVLGLEGAVHVVDFPLLPELRDDLLATLAACKVTVERQEAATVLTLRPTELEVLELTARVLDGGLHPPSGVSLEAVAKHHLSVEFKPLEPVRANQLLRSSELTVMADRGHAVVRLAHHLTNRSQEADLEGVVALEAAAAPVVVAMQQKGICVDKGGWSELVAAYGREATALEQELREGLCLDVVNDAELLRALQAQGLEVQGTSREALAPFLDHPLVPRIIDWHQKVAFGRDLGPAVSGAIQRSPDARVRATWHQLGCATGRMSCSSPNLLGIPRAIEVRRHFIPAPGHLFVVADYRAIELRVVAELTEDPCLIEVFTQGGDPHLATAASLTGKMASEVSSEERRRAKAVNFGLVYAMGTESLRGYALAQYGVLISEEDARKSKAVFAATYPGITAWQQKTRQEMPRETRTPQGRVRYFPSSRDGYNARLASPVQGTVADGLKLAMARLGPKVERLGGGIVLAVHDELVVEVPEHAAEEASALVSATMKGAMEEYVGLVPIEVKTDIRKSWAEGG